jgi:serine/threonine protein kinase
MGLLHLHSNDIVHRDIKCLNVFVKDGCLKIGDMGESRFLNKLKSVRKNNKLVGTPLFFAPEVIK